MSAFLVGSLIVGPYCVVCYLMGRRVIGDDLPNPGVVLPLLVGLMISIGIAGLVALCGGIGALVLSL